MLVSSMGTSDYTDSATDLDSHANMIVVGGHAFVFSHSGQSVDVKAFTDEVSGLSKVPIVDAVIAYNFPHTGGTFLLAVINYLCVPVMEHNLLPHFILREAGLVVNDTPKIHIDDPSVEDHSIFHVETRLRIPLRLSVIFSVFKTRSLNKE